MTPDKNATIPIYDMSRSERSYVRLQARTRRQVVPETGWSAGVETAEFPVYPQPTVPAISTIGVNNSAGSIFSQKADVLINFASAKKPSEYYGIEKEFMQRFPEYKKSYERWSSQGVNGFRPGQAFWFQPRAASGNYDGPAILTLMTRSTGYAASEQFGQALKQARKILDKQFPEGARVVMPDPAVMHTSVPKNTADLIRENFGKKFSRHSLQVCGDLPADQTIQKSSAKYPRWSENSFNHSGRGDDYREDRSYPLDPSAIIMFGGSYLPESKSNNEIRKLGNFSEGMPISVNIETNNGKEQFGVYTAEHLYQAIKASFIIPPSGTKDPETWKAVHQRAILAARTAREAKALNRGLALDPSFFKNGVREAAMKFAVVSRAFSDVSFYNALLATGDAPIVEIAPLSTGQTPFGGQSGIESIRDLMRHPDVQSGAFQKELNDTDWLADFQAYVSRGTYSKYIADLKNNEGKSSAQIAAISLEMRKKHVEQLKGTPGFEHISIGSDGSTIEGISAEKLAELEKSESSLERVMVGNHGIYLELSEPDVSKKFQPRPHRHYNEYQNGSIKYYHQSKTVNYAEYQIGKFYASIGHYANGQPTKDAKENWTRAYAPIMPQSELDRSALFWGTAICATKTEGDVLRGNNMLGRILTQVRDDIKNKNIVLDASYDPPPELANCTLLGGSLASTPVSTHYTVESALRRQRGDELSPQRQVLSTFTPRERMYTRELRDVDASRGTPTVDTSNAGLYDVLRLGDQADEFTRMENYQQSYRDMVARGDAIRGEQAIPEWNNATGKRIADIKKLIYDKAASFGIPEKEKNDFTLSCMKNIDSREYLSNYSEYMNDSEKNEMREYGKVLRTHAWNATLVNARTYMEQVKESLRTMRSDTLSATDIVSIVIAKIAEKIATTFDPNFATRGNNSSALGQYIQGLFNKRTSSVSGFMQEVMNEERNYVPQARLDGTRQPLSMDLVDDSGLSLHDRIFDEADDFANIDPYDKTDHDDEPVEMTSLSRKQQKQVDKITEAIRQAERQKRESDLIISREVSTLRDALRVAERLPASLMPRSEILLSIPDLHVERDFSAPRPSTVSESDHHDSIKKNVINRLIIKIALMDGQRNREYQKQVLDLTISDLRQQLQSIIETNVVPKQEIVSQAEQKRLDAITGIDSWKREIYDALDKEPEFLNGEKKLFKNAMEELIKNDTSFSESVKLLASVSNMTEQMVQQKLRLMFNALKSKQTADGKRFFGKYETIQDLWTSLMKEKKND
jgi:predicted NAD-dependent protein-ADP-ribosyltransferase YbiA (DUF1768 family)